MSKILIGALLIIIGYSAYYFYEPPPHVPLLEVGACYDLWLPATTYPGDKWCGSTAHELGKFKVHKIFEFEGRQHYALIMINGNQEPIYPKSKSYGYSRIDIFDKYIGVNAMRFWDLDGKKCKPMTDKERALSKDTMAPIWRQE